MTAAFRSSLGFAGDLGLELRFIATTATRRHERYAGGPIPRGRPNERPLLPRSCEEAKPEYRGALAGHGFSVVVDTNRDLDRP